MDEKYTFRTNMILKLMIKMLKAKPQNLSVI